MLDVLTSYYSTVGKDAEHSANVFYHLTYEGSVDLDAVSDGITKEVTIFIAAVVLFLFNLILMKMQQHREQLGCTRLCRDMISLCFLIRH